MLLKKMCLVYVVMLLNLVLRGQQADSLIYRNLNEIQVTASRQDFYSEDIQIMRIDSVLKRQNNTLNLGQLLSLSAPIMVKSYGSNGALSALSLRGSGSNHTTVTWNGFSLNSLTLGLQDLSVVNIGIMQNISLTYGASGSLYGSGTFGGIVELNNETDWKSKKSVSLNGEFGSFNNKRYGIQAASGNENMQYLATIFYHKANNDYPYFDEFKIESNLKREHNELENRGVMQNIFVKLSNSQLLKAGLWYQFRDKNLPLILGSYKQPTENQKDEFLRGYLKWSRVLTKSVLTVKTGWFKDFQKYNNKKDIWKTETQRFNSDINYRYYLSDDLVFDVGGIYKYIFADVIAYNGNIDEHSAAVIGALKYTKNNWVFNASTRREYNSNKNPKPLYSLGFRYEFLPDKLSFRTNFSTKYRIPTFNEKYWQPGGNPNLKPESGWSGEVGLHGKFTKNKNNIFNCKITTYHSSINNYIEWMPSDEGSFWTSEASECVIAKGLETELGYTKTVRFWKFNTNASYSYTKSTYEGNSSQKGQQLIYIPDYQGKLHFNISYRKVWLAYHQSYNGSVFYSKNDERKLPDYQLANFYIGKGLTLSNCLIEIQLRIQNLWNTKYIIVKSHPMPGRTYYLNFNINFN